MTISKCTGSTFSQSFNWKYTEKYFINISNISKAEYLYKTINLTNKNFCLPQNLLVNTQKYFKTLPKFIQRKIFL